MPLTPLQRDVLRMLANRRSPESHVAGGLVLNRTPDSPRFSKDADIFHDALEGVAISAEADAAVLQQAGFALTWEIRTAMLQRILVERGAESTRLDWCHDSAFRFFPIERDPEFGYCLHRADLAVNKVLAMAGRTEVRDCIDMLYLHENYLSLGALCWAASGKDPGLSPWLVLDLAKRNAKYRPEDLELERLARPVDLTRLKQEVLGAAAQATSLFDRLPASDVGCLYLDTAGNVINPDPGHPDFPQLIRHFGSVRGAWPCLTDHA